MTEAMPFLRKLILLSYAPRPCPPVCFFVPPLTTGGKDGRVYKEETAEMDKNAGLPAWPSRRVFVDQRKAEGVKDHGKVGH